MFTEHHFEHKFFLSFYLDVGVEYIFQIVYIGMLIVSKYVCLISGDLIEAYLAYNQIEGFINGRNF